MTRQTQPGRADPFRYPASEQKEQPVTDDRSETQPLSEWEEKQVDAAGYAAGAIGGRAGDEDVDPVERPLQEAGQGEAEGFELAEEDLIEAAETGLRSVDPFQTAFPSEEGSGATYGEPDHEFSSELSDDDR
jgi:hypothetical protein